MVLGHELLLLACSRCCRKRGGGKGSCCPATLSNDHLHACSTDTLEGTMCVSKDTILEHIAWAVYDNLIAPMRTPVLSGYESYSQVLQCLLDNAYQGLHMCCLPCTSAMFKPEGRVKSVVMVPRKSPQKFPMMRDIWEEFTKEDQATGGQLDPVVGALKWMKEHQHLYTDAQLNFWLLLRPLTDGSEASTRHLACRLLSVWHWASVLDLPTCPPGPSSLNIGHWLWKDCNVKHKSG